MGILIQTPLVIGPATVGSAEMTSGNADAGDVLTADGAGGAAWQAPQGGGGGVPYRYVARLTQTGTSAPVATVEVNTIPGFQNITWHRDNPGYYRTNGKMLPVELYNKALIFVGTTYQGNVPHVLSVYELQGELHLTVYSISEGVPEDDALVNFPISIEIYP